jgi:hypothetical protein
LSCRTDVGVRASVVGRFGHAVAGGALELAGPYGCCIAGRAMLVAGVALCVQRTLFGATDS